MEKNKKPDQKDEAYIPKEIRTISIRELLEHEIKTRSLYGNGKIRYSVTSLAIN